MPKAWCAIQEQSCFLSPNSHMLTLIFALFFFFIVFISWFNLKTARQEGLFDPFVCTYYYTKQNSNGSSGLQHTEVAQFSYELLLPRSDLSPTSRKRLIYFLKTCTKILGGVILSKNSVNSFTIKDWSFFSSNRKKPYSYCRVFLPALLGFWMYSHVLFYRHWVHLQLSSSLGICPYKLRLSKTGSAV